jgi:hypothetical protein
MPELVTATATVATAAPQRYAKQLAAHLGRRCEVREEADGVRLIFADGDCLIRVANESIELRATAAGTAELDHVTRVVGSHLERFGQRNELTVQWRPSQG